MGYYILDVVRSLSRADERPEWRALEGTGERFAGGKAPQNPPITPTWAGMQMSTEHHRFARYSTKYLEPSNKTLALLSHGRT